MESLYMSMVYPRNLLCLLLSGVSNQVMMTPIFTLVIVSLKIRRKATNGNYHSPHSLPAQLPEFKDISLMVGKEKQN